MTKFLLLLGLHLMKDTWFVILNPASGGGSARHKWNQIKDALDRHQITYQFAFTDYPEHSRYLVQNAIKEGCRQFISVGGDGTLHNVINGVMRQKYTPCSSIKIGIIPVGTGNDWAKTYGIPKNIHRAIDLIVQGHTLKQDIGYMKLLNEDKTTYFNNAAGLGFDGFIVSKMNGSKSLGALSYIISSLKGFYRYRKYKMQLSLNGKKLKGKTFMTVVGICKYSAGGMQLSENPTSDDGLLDITWIKNIYLIDLLTNILDLFTGKIVYHPKITTFKTEKIRLEILEKRRLPFIQADGELIGKGGFEATIIPQAIQVIIP